MNELLNYGCIICRKNGKHCKLSNSLTTDLPNSQIATNRLVSGDLNAIDKANETLLEGTHRL